MAELLDYFTQIKIIAADYPTWLVWVGIVVVLLLSQLAKLPIKYLTKKIKPYEDEVKNEKLRKKINAVIMLLPIGFGFLASWALTFFGFSFSTSIALVWGTSAITIYGFISRIFMRIKNGESITEDSVKSDLVEAKKDSETAEERFYALTGKSDEKK